MKLKTVVYAFAKYNEHGRSYASDSHWPYALSRWVLRIPTELLIFRSHSIPLQTNQCRNWI